MSPLSITVPIWHSERSSGQAVLIVLMALAFAAIVLAKVTGGGAPAAAGDGPSAPGVVGPSIVASPGASVEPTATTPTDPGASAPASSGTDPSAGPGATDPTSAPATRSYKVKAGDTLIGIAAKFGTTPKAITKLNGISDPSSLKVGQVLKIP